MSLRLREFPDRGLLVWFALTAGIAAWIVHLTVFAALVTFVHDNGLLATWLSWLLVRAGDEEEDAGTPGGRIKFLGLLGLLVNALNLLLIVLEGSYIYFIGTGRA
jgi:hypothetical protein